MLDFEVRSWTYYNEHDPVKSHEVARFCYTLHLSRQLDTRFDEPHFTLSMRVISIPYSLNGSTMLVCKPIGSRLDLERKSVTRILDEANPSLEIWPVKVTPEHECDSARACPSVARLPLR